MNFPLNGNHYAENYSLIASLIVPRPIAWISTLGTNGILNLAPFSYFMGLSSKPPTLAISISNKRPDYSLKDTAQNILDTREFVVNIVTSGQAQAMMDSSFNFPSDADEFAFAGVVPEPSHAVQVPGVKESSARLECRLYDHQIIGDGDPGSTHLIIGEIISIYVNDGVFSGSDVDIRKLDPLIRLGKKNMPALVIYFNSNSAKMLANDKF